MRAKPARDRVPAVPRTGEDRIAAAFALRRGRAALMPYLMGGFPDMPTSRAIGEAYAANGADLVELGVPYSDPLADGPVIHAAGTAALQAGATIGGVLEVAEALARRLPVVLMCYVNLVLARGADAFAAAAREAGVSGLIVPDLPLEEAPEIQAACDEHAIALVPLVAPTTPDERLARIGARARGFLYTVAVTGTTGERDRGEDEFREILDTVRPGTLLGTFHCPWTDSERDGALRNKLAIDLRAQAEYVDIRDDRVQRYFSLRSGESIFFETRLNAAYLGKYYLPGASIEAMYDAKQHARLKGQWVQVVSPSR